MRNIRPDETWELRRLVMCPDCELEYVKLADDHMGIHYGLYDKELLISVISVFIRNNEAQFRHFATRTDMQGKGYGTKLLVYVMKDVRRLGAQNIWCNERKEKALFYLKFGLKEVGQRFERDGTEYVTLSMDFS